MINFLPDDYVDFRGERFVLDYVPTAKKIAFAGSVGNAFSYELIFISIGRGELERCDFLDIVLGDNLLHYTGFPEVQFTGDVRMLANRIQANLNRLYPNLWTVTVANDAPTTVKNISISDGNCLDALVQVQAAYELNFTIKNRTITIGAVGTIHAPIFEYGKNKGLYSIDRIAVSDEAVVTRLRCYGSKDNLPLKYKKGVGSILPTAQYIPSLMLPDYETTGIDYLDAIPEKIAIYGIREGIFRDENIKPSIEGITGEQIRAAGGTSASNGRIDVIVSSTAILTPEQADFQITIPDIGFNMNNFLGDDTLRIKITDGRLGGVALDVTQVVPFVGGYTLTVNRNTDSNFPLPDDVTYLSAGDHYVLTGLFMPDIYVKAAEIRLRDAGIAYLAEYDHSKATYAVGVGEMYMMSSPVSATVMEGDLFKIADSDLALNQPIIIQQLNISYGGVGQVPIYEIVLSDKPIATTLNRIQDNITEIQIVNNITREASEKTARRNSQSLNRLKDYTFDPMTGKFRTENIEVGSISALYLEMGVKASNFIIKGDIKPNYLADPNKLAFTKAMLVHREVKWGDSDTSANYVWNLPAQIITLADPIKVYYIYAKCSKTNNTGTWEATESMLRYDSDANYYFFRVGVLYEVVDNVRGEAFDYGKTWINGRFITTGRIQSVLGEAGSYFDLDSGELRIGASDLELGGVNLIELDAAGWEVGSLDHATGASVSKSTAIRSKDFIPIEKSGMFTVNTSASPFDVIWYDGSNNLVMGVENSIGFDALFTTGIMNSKGQLKATEILKSI